MSTKMFSPSALHLQASSKTKRLWYHSNYITYQNLPPGFMLHCLEEKDKINNEMDYT